LNEPQSPETLTSDALVQWLTALPYPRPFFWQRYVYWRRAVYGLVTTLMLLGFVGVPFVNGVMNAKDLQSHTQLFPYWTTIILGALVVGAFALVSLNANRLLEDCKWLAQFGAIGEASVLWVFGSDTSINVTYCFYDLHGRERQREACITSEMGIAIPAISAGDTIPVLFDPQKPGQRNMLWTEVSCYVRLIPERRVRGKAPEQDRGANRPPSPQ